MAKVRINTGGKILAALLGLTLIGFVIWQFVIPKKDGVEEGITPEFTSTDGEATDGEPQAGGAATADGAPVTPGLGRPLKVHIVTWGGFAPGLVANNGLGAKIDSDYWKKYNLAVEFKVIDDYPASRTAFKAGGDKPGGVDIIAGTVDAFALEYETLKDFEPTAFMLGDWSRGGDAVAVSADIQKVSDLKGKRIALAEGTPSHYLALYLLSQADMKTSDVNWVFTASAIEAAALFREGKVDAAVSWAPDVYMAAEAREGGHILTSTAEASSLIAAIFIARGDFAKEHPDVIKRFMLGWFDGQQQAASDPEVAVAALAKSFEGINAEAATGMLQSTKLVNYPENLAFFEVTGDQLRGYPDIFLEASKLWRSLGMTSGRTPPEASYSTDFLKSIRPEAEKRFGAVEEEAVKPTQEFTFEEVDQEEAAEKEAVLTRRISIFFPSGEYELDENQKFILDEAASLAQAFGGTRMRVTGNTDTVGNRSTNMELSRKRAQAVVDYMVEQHDFPKAKFVVVGAGPTRPIAENTTEEGRKKNRRTDFEIIP